MECDVTNKCSTEHGLPQNRREIRGLRAMHGGPAVTAWWFKDLNSQPSNQMSSILTTELPLPKTKHILSNQGTNDPKGQITGLYLAFKGNLA